MYGRFEYDVCVCDITQLRMNELMHRIPCISSDLCVPCGSKPVSLMRVYVFYVCELEFVCVFVILSNSMINLDWKHLFLNISSSQLEHEEMKRCFHHLWSWRHLSELTISLFLFLLHAYIQIGELYECALIPNR